jgi:Uma2 family endonuclease
LFYLALKKCETCRAYQAIDFKITEDTIVQPDIPVFCKKPTNRFVDFPPALVAEVLLPSTALKDRHSKSGLYAGQGIPYYIIISPDSDEAEVYMLEENSYVLKQKGAAFPYTFTFEQDCSATVDFSEIWK